MRLTRWFPNEYLLFLKKFIFKFSWISDWHLNPRLRGRLREIRNVLSRKEDIAPRLWASVAKTFFRLYHMWEFVLCCWFCLFSFGTDTLFVGERGDATIVWSKKIYSIWLEHCFCLIISISYYMGQKKPWPDKTCNPVSYIQWNKERICYHY